MLEDWNKRCRPPWTPEELGVKMHNAYNYGQNEPGAKTVLPDEFPVIPEKVSKPQSDTPKGMAIRLADFAQGQQQAAGYLVKGLLQRGTYSELFGAPGAGKTFVALDIAYHVAAGLPWMERKVHAGPVLYLAYEGLGGLVKRAQALRQRHGEADVPLYIAGGNFNLREPKGRQALGQVISELPERPALIVIDTFARALMGGDENSAQDVGAFNSAVAALIESTGACVILIHHPGKQKTSGARGSSALLGAVDTEIEIDNHQVIATKQRDIELTPPIGFKLVPVMVGVDEDGDELTSCVVESAVITLAGAAGQLTGNQKRGFEALCAMSPNNAPVQELAWREACRDFLGDKAFNQRFWDVKKALLKKQIVFVDGNGGITRRLE